jgi:NAD(P)-dependent dehydrogenase (short-subunit alcohol dehydrogenase family)
MPGPLTPAAVGGAFDLTGRRALVTGADHEIGRAVALALAAAGAGVVAGHGRDGETAQALARELKATGGPHTVVLADVTTPAGVAVLVQACRVYGSTLDLVVTQPELDGRTGWHETLDATLTAAMLVARGAQWLLGPDAAVVHIGVLPGPGAAVAVAASGLAGLTRSLAHELGPRGVRVNAVAPAPGPAEDVAAVALFLASGRSAGIAGETVVMDGGA